MFTNTQLNLRVLRSIVKGDAVVTILANRGASGTLSLDPSDVYMDEPRSGYNGKCLILGQLSLLIKFLLCKFICIYILFFFIYSVESFHPIQVLDEIT